MRTTLVDGEWTAVLTTTVDTLISAEGGDVRLQTGDTAAVTVDDGHKLKAGEAIVFPAGLTVSATPINDPNGSVVIAINFGV